MHACTHIGEHANHPPPIRGPRHPGHRLPGLGPRGGGGHRRTVRLIPPLCWLLAPVPPLRGLHTAFLDSPLDVAPGPQASPRHPSGKGRCSRGQSPAQRRPAGISTRRASSESCNGMSSQTASRWKRCAGLYRLLTASLPPNRFCLFVLFVHLTSQLNAMPAE